MFPRLSQGVVSQHESTIVLRPAEDFSIFEANIWGMLYYATEIAPQGNHDVGQPGIHLYSFIGHTLAFLRHAGETLLGLGYKGPVVVELALKSIRGIPWLSKSSGNWLEPRAGSELDDEVTAEIETTSDVLKDGLDEATKNVLRLAFFATNWPEVANSDDKLAEKVRAGYEYNHWS